MKLTRPTPRYVHHLTADLKALLTDLKVTIPLLSSFRHSCEVDGSVEGVLCEAYQSQISCADCHSQVV